MIRVMMKQTMVMFKTLIGRSAFNDGVYFPQANFKCPDGRIDCATCGKITTWCDVCLYNACNNYSVAQSIKWHKSTGCSYFRVNAICNYSECHILTVPSCLQLPGCTIKRVPGQPNTSFWEDVWGWIYVSFFFYICCCVLDVLTINVVYMYCSGKTGTTAFLI